MNFTSSLRKLFKFFVTFFHSTIYASVQVIINTYHNLECMIQKLLQTKKEILKYFNNFTKINKINIF